MTTLTYTSTLDSLTCGVCEIPFAIPRNKLAKVQADGSSFWCPNGHKISYHQSRNDELEAALAAERRRRQRAEARETSTRDQLEATERSLRGHKAAKTRIKNRIAAGVCPCCNRRFENLARHMSGQHPDFTQRGDA
ncbi:hypothetical protein [Agromyces sp. NBRC 114283]|uniref:hypothetical protein n=1 Tax=Agromyces sp. NBRC 114283 TaxID=2994521 RepID=UPI0024A310AD|nr:hypothetical protein [Agromyces sp. NBRC 114283]GLU91324.1 hypothetical protein Agsp01_35790 [Agromyces sp. NBRC 114283]